MICIIKLGDWVEGIINVITFGRGKDLAMWIAKALGYKDCGCESRRIWLNSIVGCKEKQIKLW